MQSQPAGNGGQRDGGQENLCVLVFCVFVFCCVFLSFFCFALEEEVKAQAILKNKLFFSCLSIYRFQMNQFEQPNLHSV